VVTGTWLVDDFPFHIWDGIILPIDELIFFRGVGQPPTRKHGIFYGIKNGYKKNSGNRKTNYGKQIMYR